MVEEFSAYSLLPLLLNLVRAQAIGCFKLIEEWSKEGQDSTRQPSLEQNMIGERRGEMLMDIVVKVGKARRAWAE